MSIQFRMNQRTLQGRQFTASAISATLQRSACSSRTVSCLLTRPPQTQGLPLHAPLPRGQNADPDAAIAAWRRLNRPARSARPISVEAPAGNVLQFQLSLAERTSKTHRIGGHHGRG